MSPSDGIAIVFLAVGVIVEVVSCFGMWRVKDTFDRLHFLGPASTIGPVAIALFVLIEYGFGPAGIKTIVLTVALAVFGPVLSHATARAARIREFGSWQILEEERVER